MAKVYPQALLSSAQYLTTQQEVFTVWMKSLVLNGNGCTVFNSSGQLVYRVDNYDSKCADEVFLMDSKGNLLFTVLKKKFRVFGTWEGYKFAPGDCGRSSTGKLKEGKNLHFKVKKPLCFLRKRDDFPPCEVLLGLEKNQSLYKYKMEDWAGNGTCKIVDNLGALVAEVKRKQSTSGVVLGEDVLTMVVEPNYDHSLIMGFVVVCALINHQM
ncbi:LURP-one-related [Dillenia turbinata]|uniref:LURP-one-related n=1 Tax=Dillenia turbinata TaxID=194707 RepID=A0AAN8UJT5_9MAGN